VISALYVRLSDSIPHVPLSFFTLGIITRGLSPLFSDESKFFFLETFLNTPIFLPTGFFFNLQLFSSFFFIEHALPSFFFYLMPN